MEAPVECRGRIPPNDKIVVRRLLSLLRRMLPMKIIDIQSYGVNLGGGNHIFVKVISDEHIYGIGEAYRVGPDVATVAVIDDFKGWLLGEDPFRIEHLWRLMYNGSRFPGGSIGYAALSGIEIALWDLKGRAMGRPIYELIGGRCRDRVRVYRAIGGATPAALAAEARRAVDEGFTAVKMAPQPPDSEKTPWGEVLRGIVRRMEAVRTAVGDAVDVGLDPHARIFEPYKARELTEAVRPYRPMFVEEPLRPENIPALAALRREVGVPIATGEMLYTKYAFRDILAGGAADIIQPDLLICGGLLEAKKIAAMAEAHYVTLAPHSPLGPVSTAVAVQFAASTPNFLILEYQPDQSGPSRELVRSPLMLKEGHLRIPDQPGLGIELNEAAFAGKPLKPWRRPLVIEPDGNIGYQ
jgi:galactonate dehydratase